ncbi:hypothetical protein T484DRAFT_1975626 [Baffinella frigidus]|nr:hypothetical protein T484DRAFT_1975626 [Cryptophyta sp. CCMP2293]|mmetsp:Transcript_10731/g.26067  ORF Transcript_10731/g.26067 Transcript_10731/m.26067 type:complete len:354 (+) Transcript_10731:217-1278(+)
MAMYFSNAMKKDRHALTPFKGRYQELVLLMLSSAAIGGLLTGSMFSTEPLPETMLIPAPGTHGKRLGYMPPASKGKMEMLQMEASAPKKEDMWVETVLLEPRVFLVHNILSLSECDHLIALAKRHGMQKALIQPYGESGLVESSTRTNTAAWLNFKEDSVVASLEEKMAALTGTTPEQAENLQILHYAHGKEFKAHHDFFDPATDPPENFAQGGNRRYTFLVYLQTPEEGGGTKFMHPNVTIKADPGTAILFYDMKDGCDDGTKAECVDRKSEHAGLPPIKGEKWVATKWIHERQYQQADVEEVAFREGRAGCYDRHPRCLEWKSATPESECDANRVWMHSHCPLSCGVCKVD